MRLGGRRGRGGRGGVALWHVVCFILRTYWIVEMSWTADGLLLACITKRGCLLIIPRFGQALRLIAQGCSVDLGPCTHLPVHPLITVV